MKPLLNILLKIICLIPLCVVLAYLSLIAIVWHLRCLGLDCYQERKDYADYSR